MEALSSPTPILVALLTAIVFLCRAWPRGIHPKTLLIGQSEPVPQVPEADDAQAVSKESDFPEIWLNSNDIFQLERRAVFSKSWLYLSHRSQFTKPGDYQSFEVAGFPIFLILGKDGEIRAFHNVCRHRAYTVTNKERGSSTVLGCRYHGWSYSTKGELIKAPHFENVLGFDKSQNGLFAIHVQQSTDGLIFVNLEADASGELLETDCLTDFVRRNGPIAQSRWIGGKAIEGVFNWKMAVVSEKQFGTSAILPKLARLLRSSLLARIKHHLDGKNAGDSDSLLFPNVSLHTIKDSRYWYSLSFHPASERKTLIRYDLYCFQNTDGDVKSELISDKIIEMITEQVTELENQYQLQVRRAADCSQEDVTATTTEDRDCRSRLANSNLQKLILEQLKTHTKLEELQGMEVHPAMRQPRMTPKSRQADRLCRELECRGEKFPSLAW
ncbi:putative iron-sulfur cluster-binding protein [Aspergillus novofumigatus IBT 16806]|uniref:Putative iron-sulfur cluster-binding protein n=1 Tax=Aspergillus novofumigatus (strain IBT 16806) TaxID=1392255 RepID=A0A2I1CE71_ASPN1|nr:putative iron-sulfur cluster-binding protein [Aspergillus novofumigatus IBT 16806]PKX95915.1 putative iron-sulfur cluster-binding protein [Aspergillus novofumigatus IBT 16806]